MCTALAGSLAWGSETAQHSGLCFEENIPAKDGIWADSGK